MQLTLASWPGKVFCPCLHAPKVARVGLRYSGDHHVKADAQFSSADTCIPPWSKNKAETEDSILKLPLRWLRNGNLEAGGISATDLRVQE